MVGVVDRGGQEGQDAQHLAGVALFRAGPLGRLDHHLPGLDDDVFGAGDQDASAHVATGSYVTRWMVGH